MRGENSIGDELIDEHMPGDAFGAPIKVEHAGSGRRMFTTMVARSLSLAES